MNFVAGSTRWLAALCSSRVLSATWFVAYSAVLPLTQAAWDLSGKEAGMIQAAFHLGYLTSLFIVGFIADHYGAKRAYLVTGIAAWTSPIVFVLFADGFWSAFWLHALTGLCQGGSYTPALALINDNVARERRGRAMGFLIAGSSAGYAICLVVAGAALRFTDWRGALAVVAALPALSWFLATVCAAANAEPRACASRRRIAARLAARRVAQPPRHAVDLGLQLPQLGIARPVGLAAGVPHRRAAPERQFRRERACFSRR